MTLEPDHRRQIELLLGRPLEETDLERRSSLNDLSQRQQDTGRLIRQQQLVLCAIYLRACAPVSLVSCSEWISDDENDDPKNDLGIDPEHDPCL